MPYHAISCHIVPYRAISLRIAPHHAGTHLQRRLVLRVLTLRMIPPGPPAAVRHPLPVGATASHHHPALHCRQHHVTSTAPLVTLHPPPSYPPPNPPPRCPPSLPRWCQGRYHGHGAVAVLLGAASPQHTYMSKLRLQTGPDVGGGGKSGCCRLPEVLLPPFQPPPPFQTSPHCSHQGPGGRGGGAARRHGGTAARRPTWPRPSAQPAWGQEMREGMSDGGHRHGDPAGTSLWGRSTQGRHPGDSVWGRHHEDVVMGTLMWGQHHEVTTTRTSLWGH